MVTEKQANDFNRLQAEMRKKHNMQCQECFSVLINRFDDRFGGKSRFECQNCGCTWHAK